MSITVIKFLFLILVLSNTVFSRPIYNFNLRPGENNTISVDINKDKTPDIVTITSETKIIAIDGKTLKLMWNYSKLDTYQQVNIFIKNNNSVIFYTSTGKMLFALDIQTGKKLWEYKLEHPLYHSIKEKLTVSENYLGFWDNLQNYYIIDANNGNEVFVKRISESIESSIIKKDMLLIKTRNKNFLNVFNIKKQSEIVSKLPIESLDKLIDFSDKLLIYWDNNENNLVCYDLINNEKKSYHIEGRRPISGGAILPDSDKFFVSIYQNRELKFVLFDKKFNIISTSSPPENYYHYLYYNIDMIKFKNNRVLIFIKYPGSVLITLDHELKYINKIELSREYLYGNTEIYLKEKYLYRVFKPNNQNQKILLQKIDYTNNQIINEQNISRTNNNRYNDIIFVFNDNNIITYSRYSSQIIAYSYEDLSERWNSYIGMAYSIKKETYEENIIKKIKDSTDIQILNKLYIYDKKSEHYILKSNFDKQEIEKLTDIFKVLKYNEVRNLTFLSSYSNIDSFFVEYSPHSVGYFPNHKILLLNNQNGSIVATISSETFGAKSKYSFWSIFAFILILSPVLLPLYFTFEKFFKRLFRKTPAPLKITEKTKTKTFKPPKPAKVKTINKDEFTSTVMDFINKNNGEISILELMGITGYKRDKCEKLINKMIIDYEGEIKVKEDSNIIYDFGKFTREHEKTINNIIQLASRKKNILTATTISAELGIDLENAINHLNYLVEKGLIYEETKDGITYFKFP